MPPSLRPEHVLASILSATESGILSVSLDGTIQSWGAGAERLYGYTAAEVIGHPLAMLLPIYEIPASEEFLRTAKTGSFAGCENSERLGKHVSKLCARIHPPAVQHW